MGERLNEWMGIDWVGGWVDGWVLVDWSLYWVKVDDGKK